MESETWWWSGIGYTVREWYRTRDRSPISQMPLVPDTGNVIVQFAPTGQRIPAQSIALETEFKRISVF
jgi:hypothetical protein